MPNEIKIKNWLSKNTRDKSYFTLSVIIREQDEEVAKKIRELRQKIVSVFKDTRILYDPYDVKDKGGLLVYPEDRFHFSLVNFLTYECSFEDFKNDLGKEKSYHLIKEKVIEHIEEARHDLRQISRKAKIDWFYNGENTGNSVDSFSLRIFPDDEGFIEKLEGIAKSTDEKSRGIKFSSKIEPTRDFKVKCQTDKSGRNYFPVNVLRFMSPDKLLKNMEAVIGENDAAEAVHNIINPKPQQEKLLEGLTIDRLVLVESDPFLCKWNKVASFTLN